MVENASNSNFGSTKALVVDDDEETRLIVTLLLKQNNYEVIEAYDGQTAVDLFIKHKPDIVFMDVIMPVKDGYQAAREIKVLSKGDFVPIIFVTALSSPQDLEQCIEAGGDDFISKPIDLMILKAKMHSLARIRGIYRRLNELTHAQNTDRELSERMLKRATFAKNSQVDCIKSWFDTKGQFHNDIFLVMHTPGNGLNIFLGNFNLNTSASVVGALPCSEVFHSMTKKGFSISDILDGINKKLIDIMPKGICMNAIFININERVNQLKICNMGMPDVFLISDKSKKIVKCIESSTTLLGQDEHFNSSHLIKIFQINKDNRLILCGNGLRQSKNSSDELFDAKRLKKSIINGIKKNNILETLKSDISSFVNIETNSQTLSIIEFPCNDELIPVKTTDSYEIKHNKKSELKKINSKNSIEFEFLIKGKNLRTIDPVPALINFLQSITDIKSQQEVLFTIFTELYVNSLDHGILELESSLKNTADGFTKYFQQRQKKIQTLSSGHIKIKLTFESSEVSNRLDIIIEDSGPGFDFEKSANKSEDSQSMLSGRGITLVKALCDSFEYHKPGNKSTSIYTWSTQNTD